MFWRWTARRFPEAPVRVQVKCTSQWSISGSQLTYPVEAGWVRKWDAIKVPLYFVVVIVPKDVDHWVRQKIAALSMRQPRTGSALRLAELEHLSMSQKTNAYRKILFPYGIMIS